MSGIAVQFITSLYGPQWDQELRRYEKYDISATTDSEFVHVLDKWINDNHIQEGHRVVSLQFVPKGIDQEQGYLLTTEY